MSTISYTCTHAFVANPPGLQGQVVDRPWVEVVAQFGGHLHRVWCLVDTGADDTILDLGTAAVLRLNLAAMPRRSVTTAGGAAFPFRLQPGVQLDFARRRVTADVLFGRVAVPLLGRSALVQPGAGTEAGFEASAWQHT